MALWWRPIKEIELTYITYLRFAVYCYYAEDTVERNVLDLAARQGLSLYTKENAAGTLNVSAFELDDAKKVVRSSRKKKEKTQKGDFIFQYVFYSQILPNTDVVTGLTTCWRSCSLTCTKISSI